MLSNFKAAIHPNLSHCAPVSVDIHTAAYYQGIKGGILRPKLGSYHLMDFNLSKILESESSICPELSFNGETISTYYNCCTVDNVFAIKATSSSNQIHASLNNKIVTYNNNDFYYIYGNAKHSVPANAALYMGTGPVVVLKESSILESFETPPLTALNFKCDREFTKDLWDDFALKVHSGQMENKCVQAMDQRNVYIIRNGTLHYINFQEFVSLGFDFADVIKLLWPTFEQLHIGPPLENMSKGRKRRRLR